MPTTDSTLLDLAYEQEAKEFHFHVCFMQENKESVREAEALFEKIEKLAAAGFFHPVPGPIHRGPWMPHVIGQFEVWCPKEHFARTYSWFCMNHGNLSVLVHPLTREEIKDHTERAVWLGQSLPLDMSYLVDLLPATEIQFTELKMGYSAPSDRLEKK